MDLAIVKAVIFHSYAKLPEGNAIFYEIEWNLLELNGISLVVDLENAKFTHTKLKVNVWLYGAI